MPLRREKIREAVDVVVAAIPTGGVHVAQPLKAYIDFCVPRGEIEFPDDGLAIESFAHLHSRPTSGQDHLHNPRTVEVMFCGHPHNAIQRTCSKVAQSISSVHIHPNRCRGALRIEDPHAKRFLELRRRSPTPT